MQISVIFDVINKTINPLKEMEKNFRGTMKTIDRVQGCIWKLNQTSELFERMGNSVALISAPFKEYEQSMAELSSITGIVGSDLERLGKAARKTGVDSGLGAKGAADAFALLASQIQVSDIGMEGLIGLQKETITLAQAGGMSMADAAGAMAGTINQFGLQANEANRIINILAAGSKYGAANIPEIAQSFKMVGAAANAAGLSVEDTAAAVEALSKNNLKGSEAGVALRNILVKMQTELGVDFNKTSMADALDKLKPKYKDAAYMAKLFGTENMAAAQFLVANSDLVAQLTQQVTDTNVATEQAAINTNTWSHRLSVQTAAFNEWSMKITKGNTGIMNFIQILSQGVSLFTSLSPLFAGGISILKTGFNIIGGTASVIKNIAKATRLMSATLSAGKLSTYAALIARYGTAGRIAAAGIWIKNTAVSAGNKIALFANSLTAKSTWLNLRQSIALKASALWTAICSKAQMVGSGITSLWSRRTLIATAIQGGLTRALRTAKVALLTGIIPALTGAISATWAWTASLLANPITWIVLGIAALVAAIVVCWVKFAEFRAVILTMWEAMKGFGLAIIQFLFAPLSAVWKVVGGLGKAIGALFKGDFSGAWDSLKDGFGNAMAELNKPFETTINTVSSIKGNYAENLVAERNKQAEYETKKKDKPSPTGGIPPFDLPDFNSITPTGNTPNLVHQPAGLPQWRPAYDNLDLPTPYVGGHNNREVSNTRSTANVTVEYKPIINISADVTQKGREDIMRIFKEHSAEIARMVREENRRSERGAYGLS